jgi:hypothetical protein
LYPEHKTHEENSDDYHKTEISEKINNSDKTTNISLKMNKKNCSTQTKLIRNLNEAVQTKIKTENKQIET